MQVKKILIPALLVLISAFGSYLIFQNTNKKNRIPGAYYALNLWGQQRAYPFNEIPDDAYYKGYEYSKENIQKKSVNSFVTEWQTIGPLNTSGRTLSVAFNPENPNTIYAGSASGGLWRSYTGGFGEQAWHYVPTGFPVLGVSIITFAPNDSNTIYIGTGEVYNFDAAGTGAAYRNTRGTYGIGILKSTDGGITWEKSLDWSYNQQRGVWAVKINPFNPNTVWAGTTIGTFKSYDAGSTWQQVHDVVMVNDLVINPVDTNIVVIGCGNFGSTGHGIYRTINGGESWTKINSNLPSTFNGKIMLDIYKQNPDIVFASIGNGFSSSDGASWLCRSTDAGATFTVMSTQDYSKWQGWFSHDVGVHPANPDFVIAVGIEVWKSTTGGSNLVQKSTSGITLGRPSIGGPDGPPEYVHSDIHDVQFHPDDPNIIYFGTDGGVFASLDGGETFQSVNGGYQTTQFYNGFSSSFQDSLFAMGGLQDNSTVIYDGDLAWIRNIGGDGSWTAINSQNDNIIYGSWQFLNIRRSTNKGSSFGQNVTPPGGGTTAFIAPYVLSVSNPDIMYAGRAKIFRSTNGGSNWAATNNNNELDGNPCLAMAISFQNANTLYAATAPSGSNRGNVFFTSNGGSSWTNITGSLPDRFPTDLAVDSEDHSIAYVTLSGFGTPHVFKTTNAGSNWVDISQDLPDVPTSAVIVDYDYPNHIYVGNDIGVYLSTDGGNSWSDFSEGLPEAVIVMDLSISPINRKVRVATHGNGVYERDLFEKPVSADDGINIISGFNLEQNYPNPFNPSTTLSFSIGRRTFVTLKVYDVLGREVAVLVNEEKQPGTYKVEFNALSGGYPIASGTYLYTLEAGNFTETKKMVFLK